MATPQAVRKFPLSFGHDDLGLGGVDGVGDQICVCLNGGGSVSGRDHDRDVGVGGNVNVHGGSDDGDDPCLLMTGSWVWVKPFWLAVN